MPCLTVDRLYNYLDGALSAAEKESVGLHLEGCPACQCALDVRRRLAQAAETLPAFEVPADFVAGVMTKIPAAPVRAAKHSRIWLGWAAAAAAMAGSGFGLVAIFSGQGVLASLQKIGASFGSYLQGALNFAAKGLKLISLAGKIIETLSAQALATLRSVADMVGPEGQAVLVGGTLVIVISGGMFLRRRQLLSERTHDK